MRTFPGMTWLRRETSIDMITVGLLRSASGTHSGSISLRCAKPSSKSSLAVDRFIGHCICNAQSARARPRISLRALSSPGIAVRRTAFLQNAYVPVAPLRRALCFPKRDGRDEPGHDIVIRAAPPNVNSRDTAYTDRPEWCSRVAGTSSCRRGRAPAVRSAVRHGRRN